MSIITNVVGIAMYPVLKKALDPKPKKISKKQMKKNLEFEAQVAAFKSVDPMVHFQNTNARLSTLLPYV